MKWKNWPKWLKIIIIIFIIVLILVFIAIYLIFNIIKISDTLNPLDCEAISGPLERSRKVECYTNVGIKLADESICEKIETYGLGSYERAKNYCKVLASRDISRCDSLIDFYKDRCKAILLKDSSYCDMKEGKPSQGCLNTMDSYEDYID